MIGVILCGGAGTRLWPASTSEHPKQLAAILGEESLLDRTVARLRHVGVADLVAVTSAVLANDVRDAVGPSATLITEIHGRNTAPAIAAAAETVRPDDVLLIAPSDHLIGDIRAFKAAVAAAEELATDGWLVVFGVPPTEAATGFGYIDPGPAVGSGKRVASFVEKPAKETAAHLFRQQTHLWNSGMLVATAGTIKEQLDQWTPDTRPAVFEALQEAGDHYVLDPDRFAAAPAQSFDTAVLEHTNKAVVIELDAGWTDVGSWRAVYEASPKDDDGNVTVGEVLLHDTSGSLIRSTTRPVAVVGLEGVVVVETEHGVLVTTRDRAEEVRRIAD